MAFGMNRWVAQAVLACVWCAPTLAGKTLLLIDNSGSMAPNYPALARKLGEIMRTGASALPNEKIDIILFNDHVTPIPDFSDPSFKAEGDTYLNDALSQQLSAYDRIWLLTDNVQDVGGNQDMSNFYSTLQSDRIKSFFVFPHKQDRGREGLLIYAINTRDGMGAFESLVKQVEVFESESKQASIMVKKLIMKPLGENVIEVQVPQGTKKEIEAGEVLAFKTTVTIGPKFSHLFFERSPAENVQIENPFLGQSCLVSEKQVGEISPDLVQTRQRSEYILNVDFGKVSFRPTFACIWRAAFERSRESSAIEAPIKIRVPRQNFRLSPEFVNEYTASNEAEAKATGKIAGLQHLPEFLAPAETTVPVRIPMQVVVMYPFWPALVVFGGGLGLLVALVFLVGAIAPIFSASMKVSACDESDRRLPAGVRSGAVLVSGHIVGRVAGTLFTPAPGVDLEGGTENASIAMPIMCTLADGSRIKLIFGERSKPSGRQPAAASGERDGGTEGPLERL